MGLADGSPLVNTAEKLDSRARGLLEALQRAGTQLVTRAPLQQAAVELLPHLTAEERSRVVAHAMELHRSERRSVEPAARILAALHQLGVGRLAS